MRNFLQSGNRLRLFPSASVTAGDIVIVGGLVGVAFANYDIANGEGVICDLYGVYDLPKAVGAWTQGAPVYWDANSKVATATATDNTLVGVAADVAASDSETGSVLIGGNSGAALASQMAALAAQLEALETTVAGLS